MHGKHATQEGIILWGRHGLTWSYGKQWKSRYRALASHSRSSGATSSFT
jgi:hypothetical protein